MGRTEGPASPMFLVASDWLVRHNLDSTNFKDCGIGLLGFERWLNREGDISSLLVISKSTRNH